jgi:hypothetical protein
MSDLEEILETAQDAIMEAVESQEVGADAPRWHRQVAVTTLILAVLAALGGLLAGMTANEALLDRTQEIIDMNRLESDRAYVEMLKSKHEILTALGETPDPVEIEAVVAFEEEMAELERETADEEALVRVSANAHEIYAIAVTLLALGITLGGMAIVIERKFLWIVGIVFGALGAVGTGMGVLTMLF